MPPIREQSDVRDESSIKKVHFTMDTGGDDIIVPTKRRKLSHHQCDSTTSYSNIEDNDYLRLAAEICSSRNNIPIEFSPFVTSDITSVQCNMSDRLVSSVCQTIAGNYSESETNPLHSLISDDNRNIALLMSNKKESVMSPELLHKK